MGTQSRPLKCCDNMHVRYLLGLFSICFHCSNLWFLLPYADEEDLVRPPSVPVDYILFPLCRFTEPEPIPWFPTWSTGRVLTFVWSMYTMVFIMAYSCNLRANLISKEFEKPIKTHQDVLDRGADIFIPKEVQLVK